LAARGSPDIIVVGAGIIGLCIARALSRQGVRVVVVDREVAGAASRAAAGLLAPTIEAHGGAASEFALASRNAYPAFLAELQEASGVEIPYALDGILRASMTGAEAQELRAQAGGSARWLEPSDVKDLEPALAPTQGALFHEGDGWVDNVTLMKALASAVSRDERLSLRAGEVTAIERSIAGARLVLDGGDHLEVAYVVLAAGAWSPLISGVEFARWVEPLRGQMLSIPLGGPTRPVYGAGAYLVPRPGLQTLVGATSERVGYDVSTTPKELGALYAAARRMVPALGTVKPNKAWAGLRPMTPDGLPLIGWSPDDERLLLACGHSRNGILMAPLTAECVASLCVGRAPAADLRAFSPSRFAPIPDDIFS
jgi:glycine oxidase ThiO